MLGKDLKHFTSVDAPLDRIVLAIAEVLAINKKIASRGEWYSHLPFGDPLRLKNLQQFMTNQIQEAIKEANSSGTEDLQLQEAALKTANVVGMRIFVHHCRMRETNRTRLPRSPPTGGTQNRSSSDTRLHTFRAPLLPFPGFQDADCSLVLPPVRERVSDSTLPCWRSKFFCASWCIDIIGKRRVTWRPSTTPFSNSFDP